MSASETNHTNLCGYPSKRCPNARATKSNGELHRFCDHHRTIANRNQQRLQQRRRLQRIVSQSSCTDIVSPLEQEQQHQQHDAEQRPCMQFFAQSSLADLSEEDLYVLEAMLHSGDGTECSDHDGDDLHFDDALFDGLPLTLLAL